MMPYHCTVFSTPVVTGVDVVESLGFGAIVAVVAEVGSPLE